jgi:uncharacterized protein with gpF-like domain
MASSRAQAYAQQLADLTDAAKALTPEARKRVLKLLEDANREILADVARSSPDSYNAARLHALTAQVDRVMEEFSRQASSQVNSIEQQAYQEAALHVDVTVAAATGTLAVQPVVDRAALQVVQGYTADLITGLTRDGSGKINAAIQRAYLGSSNLTQLANQIGTARYGSAYTGIFGQIGEHTMSVASNEIMRLHSVASVARINDLSTNHPNLGKGWRHIPVARVPRVSHMLADGQVVKSDQPFIVGGEKLMYPRDPSGAADNTINCSCLVYPAVSHDDLKSTDQERDLLASYGLSVTGSAE